MRNGSASPTWVRGQRRGQSEGLAALGKYAFWGQSQGGLHAWAEQTGHSPGEQSKASIVPGRMRAAKDPGTNLERHELEKMGSDSNLEGLGWRESWGRREGADVSRPGVSATYTSCGVTFPSYMVPSRAVMLLQDYRSGQRAS